jgi:formate dehydrogenase subunit gamma
MSHSTARALGALILGTVLAAPLAAFAQAAAAPAATPPAAPAQAAPSAPPTPAKDSTAVPGWNKPPVWGGVSESPQYASIPGRETNVLIQGQGREWRAFHNGPLTVYGGWIIGLAFLAVVAFFLVKGPIKVKEPATGRMIERFNAVERASHWTMAISFVLLALTGAMILWGKYLVLPWMGYAAFSWLTILGKNIHNFVGPLFIFSLAVMFLLFVKDNLYRAGDMAWFFSFGHGASGRFNGGEKLWFWGGIVVLGAVMAATGLILDFPNWNQTRELMQEVNVIHAMAAVAFISLAFFHVYLGTIGVEGAYRAMREGYVDENWAKEHHSLWYQEVKDGKRSERVIPAGTQPATGD